MLIWSSVVEFTFIICRLWKLEFALKQHRQSQLGREFPPCWNTVEAWNRRNHHLWRAWECFRKSLGRKSDTRVANPSWSLKVSKSENNRTTIYINKLIFQIVCCRSIKGLLYSCTIINMRHWCGSEPELFLKRWSGSWYFVFKRDFFLRQ